MWTLLEKEQRLLSLHIMKVLTTYEGVNNFLTIFQV